MKKAVSFFVKTFLVLSLVFVAGCGKDDEKDIAPPPDPEGTITVSLRNSGISINPYTSAQRGMGIDILGSKIGSMYNVWLAINSDNNFMCSGGSLITHLGKVSGLGAIPTPNSLTTSPSFTGIVAVEPGCGYLIIKKNDSGTILGYARLYVTEWNTSATNGGISGAKVKYHYYSSLEP